MNDRYTNPGAMNDVSTKIICFMNDGYTKKTNFMNVVCTKSINDVCTNLKTVFYERRIYKIPFHMTTKVRGYMTT